MSPQLTSLTSNPGANLTSNIAPSGTATRLRSNRRARSLLSWRRWSGPGVLEVSQCRRMCTRLSPCDLCTSAPHLTSTSHHHASPPHPAPQCCLADAIATRLPSDLPPPPVRSEGIAILDLAGCGIDGEVSTAVQRTLFLSRSLRVLDVSNHNLTPYELVCQFWPCCSCKMVAMWGQSNPLQRVRPSPRSRRPPPIAPFSDAAPTGGALLHTTARAEHRRVQYCTHCRGECMAEHVGVQPTSLPTTPPTHPPTHPTPARP